MSTQPAQQIEKLHEAMELLNRGNASYDDVTKLFELTLKAVEAVKTQLDHKIASNHGEVSDKTRMIRDDIKNLENSIRALSNEITSTSNNLKGEADKTVLEMYKEIKRIETLIPTLPNLEPINTRIVEVQKMIPSIPKEVSAIQVRNKLETLKGEERLDSSAVYIHIGSNPPSDPKEGALWLDNSLRS